MTSDTITFVTDIVKPWEKLNVELGKPYSVNSEISDFTSNANSLAISLKHILEACKGMKANVLIPESRPYEIISDLADSSKHGQLNKVERECKLSVSSMYERSRDVKVRFLRNVITIHHNTYGKMDFMHCAKESALFIAQKLEANIGWSPVVFNNSDAFTDEIRVHASAKNQAFWGGMTLQIVELQENGEYINVDLNGTIKFHLTSEF